MTATAKEDDNDSDNYKQQIPFGMTTRKATARATTTARQWRQ
jgi:hypothetical protein